MDGCAICKTVRNARLTGFQTMYKIKFVLELGGSNMFSIDLGSLSQWLSNTSLYGTCGTENLHYT